MYISVFQTERVLGPQACPKCSKVFCNRYRMLRHLKSCRLTQPQIFPDSLWEGKPQGPFACQHCSKIFPRLSLLRSHEQKIHPSYSCELCASALPSKTALMEHIMIAHRGLYKFSLKFD